MGKLVDKFNVERTIFNHRATETANTNLTLHCAQTAL